MVELFFMYVYSYICYQIWKSGIICKEYSDYQLMKAMFKKCYNKYSCVKLSQSTSITC